MDALSCPCYPSTRAAGGGNSPTICATNLNKANPGRSSRAYPPFTTQKKWHFLRAASNYLRELTFEYLEGFEFRKEFEPSFFRLGRPLAQRWGYIGPIKAIVRKAERLEEGDTVSARLEIL